jgi:hypothetical protein
MAIPLSREFLRGARHYDYRGARPARSPAMRRMRSATSGDREFDRIGVPSLPRRELCGGVTLARQEKFTIRSLEIYDRWANMSSRIGHKYEPEPWSVPIYSSPPAWRPTRAHETGAKQPSRRRQRAHRFTRGTLRAGSRSPCSGLRNLNPPHVDACKRIRELRLSGLPPSEPGAVAA